MKRQYSKLLDLVAEHWPILVILIGFVALAACYSVITPIFEAPDEPFHYFYVKHLADTATLPVVRGETEELWARQGHQPPLYYALGALLTSWIDTGDAKELVISNPHANKGRPLARGNKNVYIHSDNETWPYQGTTLAIHICRLLSVFLGAITVFATFLTGLELFPERKSMALGASLLVAFNPQFLFISSAVHNDNLVTTLSSLSVYAAVRLVKRGPSRVGSLVLGLLLGLAPLSKLNSLPLWPLGLLTILLAHIKHRRSLKEIFENTAMIFLPVIVIGGWWFARNWFLYADLTGLNAHLALRGRRTKPFALARLLYEARGLKMSFWAVFGWFNIVAEDPVYSFFDAISLAAFLGMLLAPIKYLKDRTVANSEPLLVLLAWVAILGGSLLWWQKQVGGGFTGRLLFPAISAVSLLLSWGLNQLLPSRYAPLLVFGLGMAILSIAAITPFRYIGPAYARPPLLSEEELSSISHPLEVNYEGEMRLLGYDIEERATRPGEFLPVTLYWQSLKVMERDYTVYLKLFGPKDEVIGQTDTYPGLGSYPTTFWQEGDIIKDTYALSVRRPVESPFAAFIEIGLYERETMRHLAACDEEGQAVDRVIIGRVKVARRRPREYLIPNPAYFDFGKVALVGYAIDPIRVKAGGTLHLTLYWQAQREMHKDYTVFTHLIDEERQIWAQKDNQPLGGTYPTSFWDEGEIVKDEYDLVVDGDAPPGDYLLQAGMYLLSTGERLPLLAAEGHPAGDTVLLEDIEIVAPR